MAHKAKPGFCRPNRERPGPPPPRPWRGGEAASGHTPAERTLHRAHTWPACQRTFKDTHRSQSEELPEPGSIVAPRRARRQGGPAAHHGGADGPARLGQRNCAARIRQGQGPGAGFVVTGGVFRARTPPRDEASAPPLAAAGRFEANRLRLADQARWGRARPQSTQSGECRVRGPALTFHRSRSRSRFRYLSLRSGDISKAREVERREKEVDGGRHRRKAG